MHRTTDGGTVWNQQNPPLPGQFYLLGVSALGPNTAWVVGGVIPPAGGIILCTTDAGATWQVQSTPLDVTLRRVSFVKPPAPVPTVDGVPSTALHGRHRVDGTCPPKRRQGLLAHGADALTSGDIEEEIAAVREARRR